MNLFSRQVHRLSCRLAPYSYCGKPFADRDIARCGYIHARRAGTLQRPCQTSTVQTAAQPQHMDASVEGTIHQIHVTPHKAVLYVTGGGSTALAWLLSVPGASGTVLEAKVPYSSRSLQETLGHEVQEYACSSTAADMAMAGYRQAAQLAPVGQPLLGLGCTCALATGRPKKGDHKVFVATHSGTQTHTYSVRLEKGARSRAEEEALASRLVVRALAVAAGVGPAPDAEIEAMERRAGGAEQGSGADGEAEGLEVREQQLGDPLAALLAGRVRCVEISGPSGEHTVVDAPRGHRVYLPGSFNPLHDGHIGLLEAAVAAAGPGWEGIFELAVLNPDKGQLPQAEVERRAEQFRRRGLPLAVTNMPLFTQKAALFPGSKFVVGYDTAIRLVNPKYYGDAAGDPAGAFTAMLLQFAELRCASCSFLVAGRRADDGSFKALKDIDVPAQLQDLFAPIDETAFRLDISSTELRKKAAQVTN